MTVAVVVPRDVSERRQTPLKKLLIGESAWVGHPSGAFSTRSPHRVQVGDLLSVESRQGSNVTEDSNHKLAFRRRAMLVFLGR